MNRVIIEISVLIIIIGLHLIISIWRERLLREVVQENKRLNKQLDNKDIEYKKYLQEKKNDKII